MHFDNQIFAIDPGTNESAIIAFNGTVPTMSKIATNEWVLNFLREIDNSEPQNVAIEMIASYGMAVGREVFETVLLIGRMIEICHSRAICVQLVYRREVKVHLCGTMKAKDPNVRQALIDKYGIVGTKKNPGPLFGISSHLWSALAVADYAFSNPNFKFQ
jgi:hypothetical protein